MISKDDRRYPLGMPRADNANYLWIQMFYSILTPRGRAGFVMASSAADARGSEQELRKKLIQERAVDVMVAIGPNFFYTVVLPCTGTTTGKCGHAALPVGGGAGRAGKGRRRPWSRVRPRRGFVVTARSRGGTG